MKNRIRPYAWGSRTAIATMLGQPTPTGEPQAELWVGAHPGDPSLLVNTDGGSTAPITLREAIADDPAGTLGPDVVRSFDATMPFLLKLLAAEAPLSLQAHPTAEQARTGYAAEEAASVPIDSPVRNYRDRSHKPEMLVALSAFEALCGFRPTATSVRLLRALDVAGLRDVIAALISRPGEPGLKQVVISLLRSNRDALAPLLLDVLDACRARPIGEFAAEFAMAVRLSDHHPGDPGILIALLMNRIDLAPGEAVYLPAGNMHAYLSGFGVEIMASSDNVLRGGLTTKHVDVEELAATVTFTPDEPMRIAPIPVAPGELGYRTPAPEFHLSRLQLSGRGRILEHAGPQILLTVAGSVTVSGAHGRRLDVPAGRSVFLPARQGHVWIDGDGTVFRARDGLATPSELAPASRSTPDSPR